MRLKGLPRNSSAGGFIAILLVVSLPNAALAERADPSPTPTAKPPPGAVVAAPPAVTAVIGTPVPVRAAAASGSSAGPLVAAQTRRLWFDLLLNALIAFLSTAAAATAVFYLQDKKEKREELREQARELRRLQFALARRAAILGDLWSQWLEPARTPGGLRHWAALQTRAGVVVPERLGLERAEFLLESDANLLDKLYRIERRSDTFLETAARYSDLRQQANVRMEERAPSGGDVFSVEQIQALAGGLLHYPLKSLSEELFARYPSLHADLVSAIEEVGDFIVKHYGGKRLRVEFERQDSEGLARAQSR